MITESARHIAKRIIWRSIAAIEAQPGLKKRIVAGTHRLGLYPALHRLYHRLALQSVSTLAEKSARHASGDIVSSEGRSTMEKKIRIGSIRASH